MTRRRLLLIVASAALATLLLALLISISRISLRATFHQLSAVSFSAFLPIILLNFVLIFLSNDKWRRIDAAWRHASDSVPSRFSTYTLTALGFAVGVFLPTQIAMSTTRTLGTLMHGKALQRGAAATLIEQAFDLFTAAFMALASAACLLFHIGPVFWLFLAFAAVLLAMLAVSPLVRLVRWFLCSWRRLSIEPRNRMFHTFWELRQSPLLNCCLGRQLVFLSTLRYLVIVAMSLETARAIGLVIPAWHMAAAIPLVILAGIFGVTPGGIGFNELAGAGALTCFGTPLTTGAEWALANRVLVAVSYCLAALAALAILVLTRAKAHLQLSPTQN